MVRRFNHEMEYETQEFATSMDKLFAMLQPTFMNSAYLKKYTIQNERPVCYPQAADQFVRCVNNIGNTDISEMYCASHHMLSTSRFVIYRYVMK